MHIKKDDDQSAGIYGFSAWCGAKVDGFMSAYLSIDNALKAIRFKRGAYPCQHCLSEIIKAAEQGLAPDRATAAQIEGSGDTRPAGEA